MDQNPSICQEDGANGKVYVLIKFSTILRIGLDICMNAISIGGPQFHGSDFWTTFYYTINIWIYILPKKKEKKNFHFVSLLGVWTRNYIYTEDGSEFWYILIIIMIVSLVSFDFIPYSLSGSSSIQILYFYLCGPQSW